MIHSDPLLQLLTNECQYEFYQAVRLLELDVPESQRVGSDASPDRETLRFEPWLALRFPAAGVHSVFSPDSEHSQYRMLVTFMGLYGPSGVLPLHYTELLMKLGREREEGLKAFLDILNHRFISLFYRSHAKYRPSVALRAGGADPVSAMLFDFMGLASQELREKAGLMDRGRLLRYCGLFTQRPRSLKAAEALLRDFLGGLAVRIRQFVPNWVPVTRRDQGRLSRRPGRNRLGHDVIVGERVRDAAGKFRVTLGPMSLAEYGRFQPEGRRFRELCQLVREFVGDHLIFDVQPIVRADEVPRLELVKDEVRASRLGRTSWLGVAPRKRNGDEPVFRAVGLRPAPFLA